MKEREQAAQELEGYGALAYSALKRAAAGTQADTSTRALAIVRKLEESGEITVHQNEEAVEFIK